MERHNSQHASASPSSAAPASTSATTATDRMGHGRTRSLGAINFGDILGGSGGAGGGGIGSPRAYTPGSPMSGSMTLGIGSPNLGGGGAEYEWADIQARTFCKWLNKQLESQGLDPMVDLVRDFSNGVKLIQLLEIMSEESLGRYVKKPTLRVQKAENAAKALNFIRNKGIKLTNIGPEDIVDGNLKLILGMIWTLILRFTIASITEEGLSAKDGLLLWCQRKTAPYKPEVDVQNFKGSFADGLALCALIHRHRPELLDYHSLDKSDKRGNTELAFKTAEERLGIPRLLEVKDLCDVEVPDERSVMTYVAEFFHKFSSEDKAETGARRVEKFAELMQGLWTNKNDFERRMSALLSALQTTQHSWSIAPRAATYPEAIADLSRFNEYKKTSKRGWVKERQELAALYSNIQTKVKTYALRAWEPREGLRLEDLERFWAQFLAAEATRSRAINATIREIKEALRQSFARAAEDFVARLQQIEQAIGGLRGSLPEQKKTLVELSSNIPALRTTLTTTISDLNQSCLEAKVEENDYTVLTFDDLEYELELAEGGVKKKIAFVDNQMVSAQHTNVTPAKLEEFEATFKHFADDELNILGVWEMHSALASLGIVYAEEEIGVIYSELEQKFGAVTYEAWLDLLVDLTKDDASSPEQLREAFRGMAGGKPYVTDIDFQYAQLPKETVRFLEEIMPEERNPAEVEEGQDRPVADGQRADIYTMHETILRMHIQATSATLSINSGLGAVQECLEKYQELKTGKKLAYVIYGLSDDKRSIIVLKTSEDKDFDTFVGELPEKECRWAVYDFEYTLPGGEGIRNKLVFVMWSPDDANVKNKMIFASSKDALRRRLEGIHIEIQATDFSEITKDAIMEKALRR
ncbi:cofilin [Kwoniella heveanensis CBS 569]|nr:cofilin [Kwoniella heveanensis CBS 569]